jgi:hypothetical protein
MLEVARSREVVVRSLGAYGGRIAVPCTITYDDGRKPKRKGKK